MKQLNLIPNKRSRTEHGGVLLLGKRRNHRPMSTKTPLHLVLRSDFASGRRSLLRHRPLINHIIKKAQRRFHIRVYEFAIVSNHIHLVVRGRTRTSLQNFFRVVAGHIAQEILRKHPILVGERPSRAVPPIKPPAREKENKFWQTRIYSRVVTWGREYRTVKNYIVQNALEARGLIPYQIRRGSGLKISSAQSNTS